MAIPEYQTVMLPLLKSLADGKERRMPEVMPAICAQFKMTEEEKSRPIASGKMPIVRNRLGWAATYMKKAGLIEQPRHGVFLITDRGKQVLAENPPQIDVQFLGRFPEFVAFRTIRRQKDPIVPESAEKTPEEALEAAYEQLSASLEADLLAAVTACSSEFFERLVVDVLVKMGYGGNRKDAGQAVGRSGDGGIDGIIKEDKLGLDTIYVQAKKWDKPVQRPEIQKFAGALQGVKARKGVFITTSSFSEGAAEYARTIENKIILIDGETLAALMVEHGVGVALSNVYEVKRLDTDYFEED